MDGLSGEKRFDIFIGHSFDKWKLHMPHFIDEEEPHTVFAL